MVLEACCSLPWVCSHRVHTEEALEFNASEFRMQSRSCRFNLMGEWCCRKGLNFRPLPYQGSALPLSYGSNAKAADAGPVTIPEYPAAILAIGVIAAQPGRRRSGHGVAARPQACFEHAA